MLKVLWLTANRLLGFEKLIRSPDLQQEVDAQTRHLSLYCTPTCVFCLKVRLLIRSLNIKIDIKNILISAQAQKELLEQGGRSMVPCLSILQSDGSRRWMYESSDINRYLYQRFGSL